MYLKGCAKWEEERYKGRAVGWLGPVSEKKVNPTFLIKSIKLTDGFSSKSQTNSWFFFEWVEINKSIKLTDSFSSNTPNEICLFFQSVNINIWLIFKLIKLTDGFSSNQSTLNQINRWRSKLTVLLLLHWRERWRGINLRFTSKRRFKFYSVDGILDISAL